MVNESFIDRRDWSMEGRRATEVTPGLRETDADLFEVSTASWQRARPSASSATLRPGHVVLDPVCTARRAGHFVTIFDVITERKQGRRGPAQEPQPTAARDRGLGPGLLGTGNLANNTFSVSPYFRAHARLRSRRNRHAAGNWMQPRPIRMISSSPSASIEQHLAGETAAHQVEMRYLAKSGDWRWMLTRGRVVEYSPEAAGR